MNWYKSSLNWADNADINKTDDLMQTREDYANDAPFFTEEDREMEPQNEKEAIAMRIIELVLEHRTQQAQGENRPLRAPQIALQLQEDGIKITTTEVAKILIAMGEIDPGDIESYFDD